MSTRAGPPLVARRYQEEILDAAKKGNIIAVLPTGSGAPFEYVVFGSLPQCASNRKDLYCDLTDTRCYNKSDLF